MVQATESPNISFEDACKHAGKLFLESRSEIERLSSIIFELQNQLVKAETTLNELKQKVLFLEKNGSGS